jgi:hypothetical protein
MRSGSDSLAADASSLKRLSNLTYTSLKEYGVPSYHKLCAISKAVGIVAAGKKSISVDSPPVVHTSQGLSSYPVRNRTEPNKK